MQGCSHIFQEVELYEKLSASDVATHATTSLKAASHSSKPSPQRAGWTTLKRKATPRSMYLVAAD